VANLPPAQQAETDLASRQSKPFDPLFTGTVSALSSETAAASALPADPPPSNASPAGRALLAAYCLLRC
jgi:hypothetical protein